MKALVFSILFFVLPLASFAAPVSAAQVRKAAQVWAKRCTAAHFRARMDRPVRDVRTYRADGSDAFHVVDFEGGGFAVFPADDEIAPVVAFAESGMLVEDSRNPLWTLVNLDLPQRVKAHRSGRAVARNPLGRRGRSRKRGWKRPAEEWHELLSAAPMTATRVTQLTDIRVAALVQSTWDQSTVGGKDCYNYYTPNGYVCGCVATAGAQLMRYHRHPSAAVSAKTFSCSVDGTVANYTMKGGVYDWNLMDLVPTSAISDASREAIGRLCYDAGVASHMNWSLSGSGTIDIYLTDALTTVFGYKNARCEMNQVDAGIGREKIEDAIFANLDAKCPVLLGILTTNLADNAGHEIVADGYGIYNGEIFTHLNLGWSGSNNAWYALPSISAGGYAFSVVGNIVYNVFPDETGELITGRILDADENPIAGATVEASYKTGYSYSQKTVTVTAQTDGNGIYALHVPSATSVTLTATAKRYSTVTTTVKTTTSKTTKFDAASKQYYPSSGTVGNSWGNDLTIEEIEPPPTPRVRPYTHATWTRGELKFERVEE